MQYNVRKNKVGMAYLPYSLIPEKDACILLTEYKLILKRLSLQTQARYIFGTVI